MDIVDNTENDFNENDFTENDFDENAFGVKGIPKSETIWLEHRTVRGDRFYLTTKGRDMGMFYLYKADGDKAVKVAKNKSPVELERKYIDYAGEQE